MQLKQTRHKKTKRPRILWVHTGGTIAMGSLPSPIKRRSRGRAIASGSSRRNPGPILQIQQGFASQLLKAMPELAELADLELHVLCEKDSSAMSPDDWIQMASVLDRARGQYDGFVVTHGTDSLSYSATALSFLFACTYRPLNKPVLFTGAQRPFQDFKTDARRNLATAISFASKGFPRDFAVFFDQALLQANRSTKSHIDDYHAFESPNFPWIARERLQTEVLLTPQTQKPRNPPRLKARFSGQIQVIRAFPGSVPHWDGQAQAIVIEAFGCGNLPIHESSYLQLFSQAKANRIPIVLCSQVSAGIVQAERYELGHQALRLGAIPTADMTFEATIVKTMLLLGNQIPYEKWKVLLLSNWAGEITPSKRVIKSGNQPSPL